jgi:tetratricopeptide (TPR) repeat protein
MKTASTALVLVATVALTAGLYSLPKVVVQNQTKQLGGAARDQAKGAAATNAGKQPEADIQHNQPLTPEQRKQADALRDAYAAASPTTRQPAADKLIAFYRSISRFDSAAYYGGEVAKVTPTLEANLRAGDLYFEAYGFAVAEQKATYLGEQTRAFYQKALAQNPNLLTAKANLAMTYVSTPTPMQGIMLLREVLEQDPTNELALFNLGMLSMRSGQYSKAVGRFRQILTNDPANRKAKFYLAVCLVETNQKTEAAKLLADVKANEKDPQVQAAIRELEERINVQ